MRAHVTPVLRDCKPIKSSHAGHGDLAGDYRRINRLRGVIMRRYCNLPARGELWRVSRAVFLAGTLVFREENWLMRLLHNHTALSIRRRLHLRGMLLVIMPMQLDAR
jgi:hypothetical protein